MSWIADFKKNENQRALSKPVQNAVIATPQATTEVSDGVLRCLDHFEQFNTIEPGGLYIYDVLYDLGKLPKGKVYKEKTYALAKRSIKVGLLAEKNLTPADGKANKEKLKAIESPKNAMVVSESKRLVLSDFFTKLLSDQKESEAFRDLFSKQEPISNDQ